MGVPIGLLVCCTQDVYTTKKDSQTNFPDIYTDSPGNQTNSQDIYMVLKTE